MHRRARPQRSGAHDPRSPRRRSRRSKSIRATPDGFGSARRGPRPRERRSEQPCRRGPRIDVADARNVAAREDRLPDPGPLISAQRDAAGLTLLELALLSLTLLRSLSLRHLLLAWLTLLRLTL